ncbi:hypothetical protein [Anoxybacillus kestanbolensis]|uniref:hypothetical protein n=1 Tax=Anoxybacillus kestanbolensis TaxID=227476 RepID=UPI003D1FA601
MIRQLISVAVAVMLVGGILFGIGKDSLANSNQKGIKESGTVTPQSIATKTKTTTIQVGQTVQTLYVTGTFETQYSDVHEPFIFTEKKTDHSAFSHISSSAALKNHMLRQFFIKTVIISVLLAMETKKLVKVRY